MSPMVLPLPGGERLAARLQRALHGADGALSIHRFPDGAGAAVERRIPAGALAEAATAAR